MKLLLQFYFGDKNLPRDKFLRQKVDEDEGCILSCTHVLKITGEIYRLKQHFLQLATAWRFTKIKLWSDPFFTRKWMNIWKSTKVYTAAFVFMGHSFWKENIEERVKLLESKVFNCCLKITMADLCKIGVKMREWHFRELSSWISKRGRAMSRLPPPSPPPG